MLGLAVLLASNCAGFKNIALQPLQAWKGVSWRTPVLRSTLTRWKRSRTHGRVHAVRRRSRHWIALPGVMPCMRAVLSGQRGLIAADAVPGPSGHDLAGARFS